MGNPADYVIGPFLIGTSIELVLQGVVSTQFVKYFGTYHDDPFALKAVIVWYLFAVRFGAFLFVEPELYQISLTGSSGIMKWYIVAPLASIFVTTFVANVVGICYYIFGGIEENTMIERWFDIALPLNMVGDIALTTSTAYFLIKYKKDVLPQSVGILNALIRLTFQTAAPATICALINFVVGLTFPDVYPSERIAAAVAPNIVLPKLSAFSMMWTLNARQHIRSTLHSHVSDTGERMVTGDAEHGSAEWKLKICIEKSKSHFAERRIDGVRDGRAALGVQDSERSEDLVFARRGNAQGAQDFEGSADDLVFTRPGNARG
ncbi:hypothetical protein B0H13DRAFT_2531304 [Mycena leptocephala]|nr:hypothetical protein B0H13DRAFT_2531304 [Mycena leptocephala]